jgi:hypothetical protein
VKRLLLLGLLLALPTPAAADGCPASQCGTTSSALPGSRHVYVRPNGHGGPLVVYDVVARRRLALLPRGLASADGRMFVSAARAKSGTTVARYALPSGRLLGATRVPWRVVLQAVSADGRRVVLGGAGARRSTRLVVLDRYRVARTVTLRGAYESETVSPDGTKLFLVHWLTNRYELKLYDFAERRLLATPTLEPDGSLEKMVGQAWTGVATRNGRWLLTLYVKGDGTAFVHALDLVRGVGHCLDVPGHAGPLEIGAAALVLSPDEKRLYVANPLLGSVTTIALAGPRVTRTTTFRTPLRSVGFSFGIGPNGAASRDGTIAFSGNRLVWRYDARTGRVLGPFRSASMVAGLGFVGRRVVTVAANGSMSALG